MSFMGIGIGMWLGGWSGSGSGPPVPVPTLMTWGDGTQVTWGNGTNVEWSGATRLPDPFSLDFTSSIPSGWTFSRTSSAQYRDASGVWQTATSGNPRFHYVDDLSDHGLLFEPATTNKLTDRNANPTDATGWTKGGDAASTLGAVSDGGGNLTTAGLGVICSGGKYLELDNTAGVAAATMTSAAAFGATTQHIISAWLYVVSGTATLTRTGAGTPETLTIAANSGFVRVSVFVTPNATSDNMQISITAGGKVRYILGQIEANTFYNYFDNGSSFEPGIPCPSTPIITNASTTTRQQDQCVLTGLDTAPWFNSTAGTIFCEYIPLGYYITQWVFSVSHGTANSGSTASYVAFKFKDTPDGFGSIIGVNNASVSLTPQVGIPTIGKYNRMALHWDSSTFAVTAPVQINDMSVSGFSLQTLDRFRIAGAPNGSSSFYGIIKKFKVYSYNTGQSAIGSDIFNSTDNVFFHTGQSLSATKFKSAEDDTNPGELRGLEVMNQFFPSNRNYMMNGAYGGSSLLRSETVGADNWWVDDGGIAGQVLSYGPRAIRAQTQLAALKAAGVTNVVIVWDQQNGGIPDTTTNGMARWQAALINLYSGALVPALGYSPPFQFEFESSRGSGGPIQKVRDVYYSLSGNASYPTYTLGPEVIDGALYDTVHWNNAGQYLIEPRTARLSTALLGQSVTGGTYGPKVVSVSRSGLTVTINVQHDGGTDFVVNNPYGFYYFDNYTYATSTPLFNGGTTTVTKTSAAQFQMTLPSLPTSGNESFMVFWSGSAGVPNNQMPLDNSPYGYLLRGCNVKVPYTAP